MQKVETVEVEVHQVLHEWLRALGHHCLNRTGSTACLCCGTLSRCPERRSLVVHLGGRFRSRELRGGAPVLAELEGGLLYVLLVALLPLQILLNVLRLHT